MEYVYGENNRSGEKKKRRGLMSIFGRRKRHNASTKCLAGTLANGEINQEYLIKAIETDNEEIKDFLFTLGCYEGESITLISIIANQYIVVIKDARYSIDKNLASSVII